MADTPTSPKPFRERFTKRPVHQDPLEPLNGEGNCPLKKPWFGESKDWIL